MGATTLQVGVICSSKLLNYAVKKNVTYMELLGLSLIRQACRAPPGSSRLRRRRSWSPQLYKINSSLCKEITEAGINATYFSVFKVITHNRRDTLIDKSCKILNS